jgi:hypothetical protein
MTAKEITFDQLAQDPPARWCDSGHVAPETFRIDGPNGEPKPTRFFKVSGVKSGIYCEICLCIANYVALRKRKDKI